MLSSKDIELFRRVKPRKGFHVKSWKPFFAYRIDRLVAAGLIHWTISGDKPGAHLELTRKGLNIWRKL
jgi:hypothetical protein